MVYSYSRILHSNRKEQTIDTHCTQKHADRKKQGTKVSLHDSIKSGSIKSGSINQLCNDRNKISVEECLQRGLRELWGGDRTVLYLVLGFYMCINLSKLTKLYIYVGCILLYINYSSLRLI